MARCGCGSSAVCTCFVVAGDNVTVTGSGNVGTPYVISAAVTDPDCDAIAACLDLNPLDTATVNMNVTGNGALATPWVVSAVVIPDPAKAGVIGPNGVGVCLSTDVGNTIAYGADGCLFVPPAVDATTVSDTTSVDLTKVGNNISGVVIVDPARATTITAAGVGVCLSTDVGNSIIFGTDGCLFVPPAGTPSCATIAACLDLNPLDTSTIDMTVTGTGTVGDPWIVSGAVKLDPSNTLLSIQAGGLQLACDDVRTCFTGGDALNYDPVTGDFDVCLSTDAGNEIVLGTDGCLYAPAAAALVTGCGLSGAGTLASPLIPQTDGAWPFICAETEGTGIFCDANGNLRTACPPTLVANNVGGPVNNTVAIPLTTVFQTLDTASVTLGNPSTCANALMTGFHEVDVDFDIGPNTSIELMFAGDAYVRYTNSGGTPATVVDQHWQINRGVSAMIPPGGSLTSSGSIQARFTGAGPADVNRVQWRSFLGAVTGCN